MCYSTMKHCESCSFFGAVLPDLGRIVESLCGYRCRVSRGCMRVSVCVAGDDADLCSELLQESLDALRALPEATLFDEGTVSSVWLEVVERATKFLRSIFCPPSSHSPHRTSVLLVPTSLPLFFGPVTCTEVPPPRATFLSRTSTWLLPSCWSWLCRGGLSG